MKINKVITSQDSGDNLNRYFNDIKNIEPLSKAEEHELIRRIQSKEGDKRACDKLVNANLKFVISVAKKYQNQGVPLLDLISEGNAGLIEAAHLFDLSEYDIKFFSYAVWWINKRILDNFHMNHRLIRLPTNRTDLMKKVKQELNRLECELERKPTLEEVTVNLKQLKYLHNLSVDEVLEVIFYDILPSSLQQKVKEDDEDSPILADTIEDEDKKEVDNNSLPIEIDRYLYHLSQNQADLLTLVLGLHGEEVYSTDDLCQAFEIDKKEVNKIKAKALKRLKKLKNIDSLKTFL